MTRLPPFPDPGDLSRPPKLLIAPKVGVTGLVAMFLLVVAAFVGAGVFWSDGGEGPTPTAVTPPRVLGMDNVTPDALAGMLPEEASRAFQAELFAFARDAARSPVADAQPAMDLEWTRYLLDSSVRNRLAALPPRVFPRLENVPEAFEDPTSVRGRLVAIWGRVDAYGEVLLENHPDGERAGWRLEIDDASGVPWIVTTAHEPDEAVVVGRWVKAYGVFTKLWPDAEGRPMLHVLLTRAIVPSFPPVTHRQPRVEWLEQVKDETPEQSVGFEPEPFYGMLNYVRQLGPAGYRELRDTENLPVTDLTGTQGATPLCEQPDAWRLQLVRLRVAPVRKTFVVDRLLEENSGNIDMEYRGYVVDDQHRPILFVTPFPRDEFDFGGWRLVEMEGFFYKRRSVSGANGKQYWQPVIIATSVTALETGPFEGVPVEVVLGVLGLGSAAMLVVLALVWRRERRREDELRARAAERRQKRQQPSIS